MTVKELQSWLRFMRKDDPEAGNYEIVVEPKAEWEDYHICPGFSLRHGPGATRKVVWRLEV